MLKRRQVLLAVGASVSGLSLPAFAKTAGNSLKGTPIENINLTHLTDKKDAPVVYYSPRVSPQAVLDIFKAVGLPVQGKVGLKVVFGNQRDRAKMIDPALLKPIADELHATLIESNYMDSARSDAATHLATAKSLGYDKVAPIDILDAEKEIAIPVRNGYHLKNFITGSHFANYDTLVSIVRFKGHNLQRYSGATKDLSICLGTARGACQVHSAGEVTDYYHPSSPKETSESMADAVSAALDYKKGRWVFINIIDALKPVDSCSGTIDRPNLGIVASTDPVAADRAALDIVYGLTSDPELRKEWEREHSVDVLDYAEGKGLGSKAYRLQRID